MEMIPENGKEIYQVEQITESNGRYFLNWHGRPGSEPVDALTAGGIISQAKGDGAVEIVRPGLFKFEANEYGRLSPALQASAEKAAKWTAGRRVLTRTETQPRGRLQRMGVGR